MKEGRKYKIHVGFFFFFFEDAKCLTDSFLYIDNMLK